APWWRSSARGGSREPARGGRHAAARLARGRRPAALSLDGDAAVAADGGRRAALAVVVRIAPPAARLGADSTLRAVVPAVVGSGGAGDASLGRGGGDQRRDRAPLGCVPRGRRQPSRGVVARVARALAARRALLVRRHGLASLPARAVVARRDTVQRSAR